MKALLVVATLALAGCAASPYAGQEGRDIKALSDAEIRSLREGAGMGFAKAAELNGYPGPMHVMEMADALALTPAQREAVSGLLASHNAEARRLGEAAVEGERRLDRLFADRTATPERVEAAVREAALLTAEVRASHLKAHVATVALLTPDQVRRYSGLRGYGHSH